MTGQVVGIDASNLRAGGGLTHLSEILNAVCLSELGLDRIVVWADESVRRLLPARPWLEVRRVPARNAFVRGLWQSWSLNREARAAGCTVMFSPGGTYLGAFRPFVTMSRNMLPFERAEHSRYGFGKVRLRLLILRILQGATFRRADGLIFLTEYAKRVTLGVIGPVSGASSIIPHGVSEQFRASGRTHHPIEGFDDERPFRIVYVSQISHYKHQWHVIEAVQRLRQATNWPIEILFVGGAPVESCKKRFEAARIRDDPHGEWCRYLGHMPYTDLPKLFASSDLGIFASSCENMPNTLVEKMASGLPIACSARGPMPEVLADSGLKFDPEDPAGLADVLGSMIGSVQLRTELGMRAESRARMFSWNKCAHDTFSFLSHVAGCVRGTK